MLLVLLLATPPKYLLASSMFLIVWWKFQLEPRKQLPPRTFYNPRVTLYILSKFSLRHTKIILQTTSMYLILPLRFCWKYHFVSQKKIPFKFCRKFRCRERKCLKPSMFLIRRLKFYRKSRFVSPTKNISWYLYVLNFVEHFA